MKLDDHVRKLVNQTPLMYHDVDYEKSRLWVLTYTFGQLGNGFDFAMDGKGNDLGYLIEKNEEVVPYGDEVYNGPPIEFNGVSAIKNFTGRTVPSHLHHNLFPNLGNTILTRLVDDNGQRFLHNDWIEGVKDIIRFWHKFLSDHEACKFHPEFPTDPSETKGIKQWCKGHREMIIDMEHLQSLFNIEYTPAKIFDENYLTESLIPF